MYICKKEKRFQTGRYELSHHLNFIDLFVTLRYYKTYKYQPNSNKTNKSTVKIILIQIMSNFGY